MIFEIKGCIVIFVLLAAASTGSNSLTPPLKPKRKKPGTAVKRKVQPIAVDGKGKENSWHNSSQSYYHRFCTSAGAFIRETNLINPLTPRDRTLKCDHSLESC